MNDDAYVKAKFQAARDFIEFVSEVRLFLVKKRLERYLKMLKQKRGHYVFPYDVEAEIYEVKIETVQEILKHLMVKEGK